MLRPSAVPYPPGVAACRALLVRLLKKGCSASSAAAALESGAVLSSAEEKADLVAALASLLDDCLRDEESVSQNDFQIADCRSAESPAEGADTCTPPKKRLRRLGDDENNNSLQLPPCPATQGRSEECRSKAFHLDAALTEHSLATLLAFLKHVQPPPVSASDPNAASAAANCMRLFFGFLTGVKCEEDGEVGVRLFSDLDDCRRLMERRVEALCKLLLIYKSVSAGSCRATAETDSLWSSCRSRLQNLREWAVFLPRLASRRSELVAKLCAGSNLASLPALLGDPKDVETELRLASELLRLKDLPFIGDCPSRAAVASEEAFKKLERAAAKWREDLVRLERQLQQQREVQRRTAFSRACVEYVLNRQKEQREASTLATASNSTAVVAKSRAINHPFFLLGLDPRGVNEAHVRRVQKQWRSLLHPDKFSRCTEEQQRAATEAFKTFQVALADAQKVLRSKAMDANWLAPPPPPSEASFADETAASEGSTQSPIESQQKAATGLTTEETIPNCMYSPEATVEALPRRKATGAFRVYVQAPSDVGGNDAAALAFRSITKVWVYVHRPVRGGPPVSLVPSSEELSLTLQQDVQLSASGDSCSGLSSQSIVSVAGPWNAEVTIDVPVVQPLALNQTQRYWVGVQVRSRKGRVSLVKWIPLSLSVSPPQPVVAGALSGEDHNANIASSTRATYALLQTFVGAPFLSRGMLENLHSALAKLKTALQRNATSDCSDAWQLLDQCMQNARIWADSDASV